MKTLMTAKKIAQGVNAMYGTSIVINTTEFYNSKGQIVRLYDIKDSYCDEFRAPHMKLLFRSASSIYTVLFMRDLLYTLEGRELPPDEEDPGWAATRVQKGAFASFDYIVETYLLKDKIVEVDTDE